MIRFLISFTVCLIVCALGVWAMVAWGPEAGQSQSLLLGLVVGGVGCIAFWLTFAALCVFFD